MKDSQISAPPVSGMHVWLILIKAFHAIAAWVPQFREGGVGDSDFRVLEALLHKGPMPVNAIGPKVFLTPGSISTAVERLREKGLVSRCETEADRRVHMVGLTAKGRKLIVRVFAAHAKQMEELAEVLTPAERVCLTEALKKLGKKAAANTTAL
jgi:MarR family 2-MHQ and catechol resistance regulon transcriptional repressor